MPISETRINCEMDSISKLQRYLGRIGKCLCGIHHSIGYDDIYHVGDSTVDVAEYNVGKLQISVVGKDSGEVAQKIVKWLKRYKKANSLNVTSPPA